MSFDEARHLVSRTGLGTAPSEVARWIGVSRADAVRQIVRNRKGLATQLPDWASEAPISRGELRKMMGDPRKLQAFIREHALELKGWWLEELVATEQPLVERMTLFWHGHFTSSFQKVKNPWSMLGQNQLFRRHALGDFRALLSGVVVDPAMLVFLDNHQNSARKPNENFARELFELFTLGEGNYSETDVKEASRALSGFGVDRRTSQVKFRPRHHDSGEKTIFGARGNHRPAELVELILQHDECAPFIVGKIWNAFVTTAPTKATTARLAAGFREDWSIAGVVAGVLTDDAFWAASNRGTRMKSPVELIVGTVRTIGLELGPEPLNRATRNLGQDLFSPPNVKGWPSGAAWIDANTLLKRNVVMRRAAGAPGALVKSGVRAWAGSLAQGRDEASALTRILLPVAPVGAIPTGKADRNTLRALLTDPAYQLA